MFEVILKTPLFYDIPEYLNIVLNHGFFSSISLGHFPIHPVFMGILWTLIKIVPVNLIAVLFLILSVFILSKISKKAALIYLLFPAVWIISTNLMIESLLIFFYILSLFLLIKEKRFLFSVCVFLMVGIHLEAIFWIPSLFLIPVFLGRKMKVKKYITPMVFGIGMSLLMYLIIYKILGRGMEGSTEQLGTYFSSGILRMVRNVWLTFSTSFGSLTIFLLLYIFIKKFNKKERIPFIVLFVIFSLIAANWQGDFMARRAIFLAVPLSIIITNYFGKYWFIFILYLIPITTCNILLYAKGSPFIVPKIPNDQVLIETHYLKPFTKYDGNTLYIGENDLSKIDEYLDLEKRVFLTPSAITAPYRLLIGNNYHITSLNKVGDSESRFLFEKYDVSKFENVYEINKHVGSISLEAGEPVIFYGDGFGSRLSRRRINYGDVGIWIYSLILNHKDPVGWTYKDSNGAWVYNEIGI